MRIDWNQWQQTSNLDPKEYICGHCGNQVGTNKGYFNNGTIARVYICSTCGFPTFFYGNLQIPGPLLGRNILHLPDNVADIYKEMREDLKNVSYTSTVLLGRKLIMHLAVDVANAQEGESFIKYVEHLRDSGFIPPNGGKILEYMKKLGNEKNHELKIGTKEEAEKIIKFIEMLLIFMYEVPNEFPQEAS